MKLLIVSATRAEIAPFLGNAPRSQTVATALPTASLPGTKQPGEGRGEALITGVGIAATTYALTKKLQTSRYDLVLQVGICGSYNRNLALGDVVFITSDQFGDLGAEDHDQYIDIFDMGLFKNDTPPFAGGKLRTPLLPIHSTITLPMVSGLTVNTVSGSERTIQLRSQKYACDTESMEGAAFHYVCLQEKIPFAQVRAVSNYVTPRDRSQWKIPEAIANLNKWLENFIQNPL